MIAPIVVAFGAATHTGLRRSLNEDSFVAQAPLFLVADGMGGHEAGDVASSAVIEAFRPVVGRASLALDDLRFAIARARTTVDALGADGASQAGSTLTGVVLASVDGVGYWLTVNVGDSRTYRLSEGQLEQLTIDHSVVQELIDSGELDAAQAHEDRRRNIITRAIGAGSTGEADYSMVPAEVGDRVLVCSDGLSSEVPDLVIREILRQNSDPQRAADQLIERALANGGRDNITAIVLDAVHVSVRPDGAATDDTDIDSDTRPRAEALGGMN